MQPAEISSRALLECPTSAFWIISVFVFSWSWRRRPPGVGGRIAHSLPCFGHAFGGVGQLAFASLQFRAQPVRRRRIAFVQLQPMCSILVVAGIVRRPTKILRVFNLSQICLFDTYQPTRRPLGGRLIRFATIDIR